MERLPCIKTMAAPKSKKGSWRYKVLLRRAMGQTGRTHSRDGVRPPQLAPCANQSRYRKSAKYYFDRAGLSLVSPSLRRGVWAVSGGGDGRRFSGQLPSPHFCAVAMSQSVSPARMRTHAILNLALQFSRSVPCPLSRLSDG